MNTAERLSDLRFVRAEYRVSQLPNQAEGHVFTISMGPPANDRPTFSIAEKDGEQFAAELDVLAAIIRARVIRARVERAE